MANRKGPQTHPDLKPPSGVPHRTPDNIHPETIFNGMAPVMDELVGLPPAEARKIVDAIEEGDKRVLDERIATLSRLVLEGTLWDTVGLSKKERAEIALSAIRVLEGTKGRLEVTNEVTVRVPTTVAELHKEQDRTNKRLIDYLAQDKALETRLKTISKPATHLLEGEDGKKGLN